MNASVFRRVLAIVVVLGMIVGLWLLPRGLSFGSTALPQPIELRSTAPVAAPASTPSVVDDDEATDDDGVDDRDDRDGRDTDQPITRRADLRGQGADGPATGGVGSDAVDDDDDDAGSDDSDDDDAGSDDSDDDAGEDSDEDDEGDDD